MEAAIKIMEDPENLNREYDAEADVLYLSAGEPVAAEGVDIGDGIIVRYDEARNEVVGVTVIGLRARIEKELQNRDDS